MKLARRARALRAAGCAALSCVAVTGCGSARVRESVRALESPGLAAVATTNGPNASMIYAARTSAGVVVVDLGWWGSEAALRGALARLGAEPRDVAAVLLTHSHRDHVGAWRLVAHAPFYVAAAEAPRLAGTEPHQGWVPRLTDRLRAPALPRGGAVAVRAFAGDTAFVVGADTVRAYVVPGHTAGSAAYLLRGVLFAGDALSYSRRGLRFARRGYSDDVGLARASVERLRDAVAPHGPRLVCTAHARCAPNGPELWRRIVGDGR